MDLLKLVALDEEDLAIISAHVQDAVLKVRDLTFLQQEKRFALAMNRFAWEREKRALFRRKHERHYSVLHFERVLAARSAGIRMDKPDEVLSLLAVRFVPGEPPSGTIELLFSGDAAVQLDVECIEARLADTGAAWDTPIRPRHRA